jgi:hypothetical protein
MKIEYVDTPVERSKLSDLIVGDTFIICNDENGDVNMFLRRIPLGANTGKCEFIILGEYPEIVTESSDVDVQVVNTKLLVEI